MKDIIVDTGPHGAADPDGKDGVALQIATTKDGHNSGRPYYIKPRDSESLDAITFLLKKNIKGAQMRTQAANSFRRVQYAVRTAYNSGPFQLAIALLIGAVRPVRQRSVVSSSSSSSPPPPPPPPSFNKILAAL